MYFLLLLLLVVVFLEVVLYAIYTLRYLSAEIILNYIYNLTLLTVFYVYIYIYIYIFNCIIVCYGL